jgi:dUTP pyrophosphatase
VDATSFAAVMEQMEPRLKFKRVGNRGEPLPLPEYATAGAAAFDLRADEDFVLTSGDRKVIPTGLAVEIPPGYELQIRPRSGLAAKFGVTVLNSPGTIDSDYRGEIGIILISFAFGKVQQFQRGERIAQAVLARVYKLPIEEVAELSSTDRGAGGFGSTGTK